MRRSVRLDTLLAVAGVLLIAALAMLNASQKAQQLSVPSTYDRGPNGLAALYELLQREDVGAVRYESPIAQLNGRGTFVIAGDEALFSFVFDPASAKALDAWVRAGGTLVALGARPPFALGVDLPKTHSAAATVAYSACAMRGRALAVRGAYAFAASSTCSRRRAALLRSGRNAYALTYPRGKGRVIYMTSADPFGNRNLAQADNAAFAYALFAGAGPVFFDERAYGYASDKSTWDVLPVPVRYGFAIAVLALLLAIAGANLPFAPPVDLTEKHVRDSSEYVASLAAMLQRANAERDAIELYRKAIEQHVAALGEHADARHVREEVRALEMQPAAGPDDVLRAAQIFSRLRKEYPW